MPRYENTEIQARKREIPRHRDKERRLPRYEDAGRVPYKMAEVMEISTYRDTMISKYPDIEIPRCQDMRIPRYRDQARKHEIPRHRDKKRQLPRYEDIGRVH